MKMKEIWFFQYYETSNNGEDELLRFSPNYNTFEEAWAEREKFYRLCSSPVMKGYIKEI